MYSIENIISKIEIYLPNISDFPPTDNGYGFLLHQEMGEILDMVNHYIKLHPEKKEQLFSEITKYKQKKYSGSVSMKKDFYYLLDSIISFPYAKWYKSE